MGRSLGKQGKPSDRLSMNNQAREKSDRSKERLRKTI